MFKKAHRIIAILILILLSLLLIGFPVFVFSYYDDNKKIEATFIEDNVTATTTPKEIVVAVETPITTIEPSTEPVETTKPVKKKQVVKNKKKFQYYVIYPPDEPKTLYMMPKELQRYTYKLCKENKIEKYFPLILCQLYAESGYNVNCISETNDYGIAQINRCNFTWLRKELGITDFMDPKQSIKCNIYLMSDYLKKYGPERALVCYNTGRPGQSTTYSRKILKLLKHHIKEI